MFSVVIPLFNKELSIRKTIASVLNQSYQNFEILVVNDGSTDNSCNVVKDIKDDRIRLINQSNQGVSAARNCGIKKANFQWVAFLDGDDIWKEDHLHEFVLMINKFPNEKVFATSFEYSDGRVFFRHHRNEKICRVEDYFTEACYEPILWTSVVVVCKNSLVQMGGFNESLIRGEDLDLWARLARENLIVKSSAITATYRVDAENRSIKHSGTRKSIIYDFSFDDLSNEREVKYFKKLVVSKLRECLVQRNFANFIRIYLKHYKKISLLNVFYK
ncbi:glycosyltransferase involved in cell wall biosynthesis [Idiomarina fontislapidosi]|uniref:Capsular biosynthesis protein CpsI n=1 Tax=Idiomarina fontislapidosi TaxID=263723 RepID=A0A432XMZ6_9GAMM|nr:glycosyltransferase family 2 protein [Idiomarina fontislapidosi]PYE30414.1 glycosyltransferase involved in cell wall biosynthesis [Idiomarina fontislapidosi]RUO50085.1 capsular biosynthesis protein CpsI [Idiomarina fontislapidosi]